MRFKAQAPLLLLLLLLFALTAFTPAVARAQEQGGDDEDVRGAFLTSRPTSSGASSASRNRSASRRKAASARQPSGRTTASTPKPKSQNSPDGSSGDASANGIGNGPGNNAKSLTSNGAGNAASGTAKGTGGATSTYSSGKSGASTGTTQPLAPLALGYTLYMRDSNGDAVRVDPSREFHNGDRVRLSLEPNTDSYLYVFHTENDGQPEMIFPDARLAGGDNFIEAHVPTEIPSSQEQNERLRWFTFYGQPARERLYIVLTREPLPLVPAGEELVNYCAANQGRCPWHPPAEIWSQVQKELNARVRVNKEKSYGQAQTASEREATTRGFGLDQNAPAPSVIRMNATSNAPVLVTALDLVHQ